MDTPSDPSHSKTFYSSMLETQKHRHRLPHWQQGDAWCFVTWRLGDSLPAAKLRLWDEERERWLASHPVPWDNATEREYHIRFTLRIENWLDQGMGACLLRTRKTPKSSRTP